jgi:hypothetical protein
MPAAFVGRRPQDRGPPPRGRFRLFQDNSHPTNNLRIIPTPILGTKFTVASSIFSKSSSKNVQCGVHLLERITMGHLAADAVTIPH